MAEIYTVQEVREWVGKKTQTWSRKRAPFKANWGRTLDLLTRELRYLNTKDVLLQGYFSARHIRRDGQLYADARPSEPGVILEFMSRKNGTRYASTLSCQNPNVSAANRRSRGASKRCA